MKKIKAFFLLMVIFIINSCFNEDDASYQLYKVNRYDANRFKGYYLLEYNDQGLCIKLDYYSMLTKDHNYYLYKYNDLKQISKSENFDNNILRMTEEFIYDNEKQIITKINYNNKNVIASFSLNKYDNNLLIEEIFTRYYNNKSKVQKINYKYFNDNNIIKKYIDDSEKNIFELVYNERKQLIKYISRKEDNYEVVSYFYYNKNGFIKEMASESKPLNNRSVYLDNNNSFKYYYKKINKKLPYLNNENKKIPLKGIIDYLSEFNKF